jgi:hypothetical protein
MHYSPRSAGIGSTDHAGYSGTSVVSMATTSITPDMEANVTGVERAED